MRTILVTGAAGTVGSVVAATLPGARGMVRHAPGPGQVAGELTDPASLAAAVAGAAVVVHCAASLSKDWTECERVNVGGTRNLVEAMQAAGGALLIHVSTVSVYDYRTGHALDEDCPRWQERIDAYGYTKAEAERVVEASGLPYVILRPVLVLSTHPRSHWGARALDRARTADAPLWPLAELPHVHVDGLAAAVARAIETPAAVGRAYNVIDGIAGGRAYNEHVFRAAGRPLPDVAPIVFELRVSGDRARRELGYAPHDRFAEFLAALADR